MIVAGLAVLVLAACGAGQPTKPAAHAPDATAPTDQLAKALGLIASQDWPHAIIALRAIVEADSFRHLPADYQYRTLSAASGAALWHGSPRLAHDYSVRATALPQAGNEDWLQRLQAAGKMGDQADSIGTLTVLMRRWPDQSRQFNSDYVLHIIDEAKHSAAQLALLQALYDAQWKLPGDIEPSAAWRDLVLRLLDKDRVAEASGVASRVTDVYVLIAMRADRRFDRIVQANAAQFDIGRAADREFHELQAAAEKSPKSLHLKSAVIMALLVRQRYEAALAAADSILLDIRSTNYPEKLFEDLGDDEAWFLNMRALALQRVGRLDEAVAQLTAASQLPEKYTGNVDQLIGLANLYCALERPNDALSSLARITARTSAYGALHVEVERLDAYSQLKDSKQVSRSLGYLRAHRADDPSAYQDALLIVNQQRQAAAELVRRLLDKDLRQDALLGVQNFAPTPETRREMELDARDRALLTRPEVRAAIEKVGRVASYPLEAP
jgi:tetratricopeptide (TPR) repeat protein